MKIRPFNLFLILSLIVIFLWSVIRPHDHFTWFLEVAPVIIGTVFLLATFRRFTFTQLLYLLLWLHAIVLIVGGHYTYALNPLFEWIKTTFDLTRNYYDRLGHFFQGFVPAILAREVLLRFSPLNRGKWLNFIVVCICLAVSAFYELVEWWVAAATGEAAESFLGTQGDVWDSQWDMFMCLVGAVCAIALLGVLHDRYLEKHEEEQRALQK